MEAMESSLMDKLCPHIPEAVMFPYFPVLPYYCLPNLLVWMVEVMTACASDKHLGLSV